MLRKLFRSLYRPRPAFHASVLQSQDSPGLEVARFQELLNKRGRRYDVRVEVTGSYDEQTRNAVRAFQKRTLNVASADGFVGPQTANRLHIRLIDDTSRQRRL